MRNTSDDLIQEDVVIPKQEIKDLDYQEALDIRGEQQKAHQEFKDNPEEDDPDEDDEIKETVSGSATR